MSKRFRARVLSLSLFIKKQCIMKQLLDSVFVILYINDVHFCSEKFNFFLFADDTNILFADKNLKSIELTVNIELQELYDWLTTNKLTLNAKISNYIVLRSYKKKVIIIPLEFLFMIMKPIKMEILNEKIAQNI